MSRIAPLLFGIAAVLAGPAIAADVAVPANDGLGVDVLVNGKPISNNHVQLMMSSINPDPSVRGAGTEEARVAARQELITQEVLAQEAKRLGLDKSPLVADQLAFQERAILSRAYLADVFEKNPITEASLESAYEFNRANGKIKEYKTRQILLGTQEDARAAIAKLDKGEDFVALAKRISQDPGGQTTGGDLGWFRPDIFIDHNFTDALVSLRKGQYTKTPVRSRFGWHVILLEDGPRQVQNPESYDALDDSAKEALRQRTAQLRIEEVTSRLAAAAKVSGPGVAGASAAGGGTIAKAAK